MILFTFISALAILPLQGVLGFDQVPIVDGVHGGVPKTYPKVHKNSNLKSLNVATAATPGKLRMVENSGICETTPGVNQASGYADLSATEHIWFWYFEARNNPDTAPLALWFNGGPGSSSMIGLFEEHGPCRITNDSSSLKLNPYSWNTNANILYIDQPVGVGFSYGDLKVGTSKQAAADIWKFMQIFLSDPKFTRLADRALGIWAESYGGHYAPAFAAHFLAQNDAIASGNLRGYPLNLQFLGVGDGLTDPLSQYPGYIAYAKNNSYHPLVDNATLTTANKSLTDSGGCLDQIANCYTGGNNSVCSNAQDYCNSKILFPCVGPYNIYYVPDRSPDPYPVDPTKVINATSFRQKIGAEKPWQAINNEVYDNFAWTGDWMTNSRPNLESVIKAGVHTLVYVGDADYILNQPGIEAMVDKLDTEYATAYRNAAYKEYTVEGQAAGKYKNSGTFSYISIYGAGHEVPAYKYGNLDFGQAALQIFDQIMSSKPLSST